MKFFGLFLFAVAEIELKPLSDITIERFDDLGLVGIKMVMLVRNLHESGCVHGDISMNTVFATPEWNIYLGGNDREITPVVNFNSMLIDLKNVVDVLESVPRASNVEHTPVELVVLRKRLHTQQSSESLDYDGYLEVLARMIKTYLPDLVNLYYDQLSVEEILVDPYKSRDLDTCIPLVFQIVNKSTWFFRRKLRRQSSPHCEHYVGYSLLGSRVDVKKCPIVGTEMPTIKEATILEILKDIPCVPRRYVIQTVRHACRASVLISFHGRFWLSLDRLEPQSTAWIMKLAITMLELVKAVHERGFVHGSIQMSKIMLNRILKNPYKVTLIDWSLAQPWKGTTEPSGDPNEAMNRKSPFGTSPRDDVYRVAEILLQLVGEPQFMNLRETSSDLDSLIASKLRRKMESSLMTPLCFSQLYYDVSNSDSLKYDEWIDCFRRQ
jgi:tRNA A-37 threonylcarbamoyl transferase component Bud32